MTRTALENPFWLPGPCPVLSSRCAGSYATQPRQPRQVRKEATVTGQCVRSRLPRYKTKARDPASLSTPHRSDLQMPHLASLSFTRLLNSRQFSSGGRLLSIELRPRAQRRAKISALGTYVPPRILSNADLATMVDTSDEWILQRLGIRERHLVEPGMATSDMAVEAARRCLANRGIMASEVEVIIVATVTPDMLFPATACLVQDKLGAHGAWGFDLSAACSGFLYALQVGAKLVESGAQSKVLVIGADTMSSIIDYTDRTTCVIFGDGAGAVLVEPAGEGEIGLMDFCHEIDGSGACALNMPAGSSSRPAYTETQRGQNALCPPGRPGGL